MQRHHAQMGSTYLNEPPPPPTAEKTRWGPALPGTHQHTGCCSASVAADTSTLAPTRYLSGGTALSLPWHGTPALWYSGALAKPQSWRIAGYNMPDTTRLLGLVGVRDASSMLRDYGSGNGFKTGDDGQPLWAATHERAVFDLLCQHCHFQVSHLPNVQACDIDDVVDMGQVRKWLYAVSGLLGEESMVRMLGWLEG